MILTTIARGPLGPVTGQMAFIAVPCQQWAARNGATAEGTDWAFSKLANRYYTAHARFILKGVQVL